MAQVETVKIRHPHESGDYAIINASDFDPEKHERYEDADGDVTSPPKPERPTRPKRNRKK